MSDETEKWKSPSGAAIASDITDANPNAFKSDKELLAEAVKVIDDLICDIHSPNDLLGKGYVCGLTTKQQLTVIRARDFLAKIER